MANIIPVDTRTLPHDLIAASYARMKMNGVGLQKATDMLSDEFGYVLKRTYVERLETRNTFIEICETFRKNVVKKAVADLKNDVSKFAPKIAKVIENALDEGDLKAITPALKILGIDVQEPETKQNTSITVLLPGAQPKEKDVT
jgi:hypothetical protein